MSRIETKITVGALIITYLAQLGGHQEIHYQIANITMGVEVGTLAALHLRLNRLAAIGLIIIAGCFVAVPVTDDRYAEYFRDGRNITNISDWPGFVTGVLWPDFTDHIGLTRFSTLQDSFTREACD